MFHEYPDQRAPRLYNLYSMDTVCYLQSLSLHVHVGGDGTSETVGSENSAAGSINSKKSMMMCALMYKVLDDGHALIVVMNLYSEESVLEVAWLPLWHLEGIETVLVEGSCLEGFHHIQLQYLKNMFATCKL